MVPNYPVLFTSKRKMIAIEKAKKAFKDYLKDYDCTMDRIESKIKHTYGVMEISNYLTEQLKLEEEDKKLAELIALLHDIGRFEQATRYDNFDDDKRMEHAEYGANILFKEGLIRKFVEEDKYDTIIYQAILNHSKLEIPKGLSEKEELHCKIIRDSDKLDNFRIKETQKFETLFRKTEEMIQKERISSKVYEDFLSHKCINVKDRKTAIDYWVCILAFIYDLNFKYSFEMLKEKEYINILVNRIPYQDEDTRHKMEEIRKEANKYIDKKLS